MFETLARLIREAGPMANLAGIMLAAYLAFLSAVLLQRREWNRQRSDDERRKKLATKSLLARVMIEACANLQRLLQLEKLKGVLEQGLGAKGIGPRDMGLNDMIRTSAPRLETYEAAFQTIASEGLVGDFTFAYILYYFHKLQAFQIPYKRLTEASERDIFEVRQDLDAIRRLLPATIQAIRDVIGRIRLDCPQLADNPARESKRLGDIVGSFGLLSPEELERCIRGAQRRERATDESSSSEPSS